MNKIVPEGFLNPEIKQTAKDSYLYSRLVILKSELEAIINPKSKIEIGIEVTEGENGYGDALIFIIKRVNQDIKFVFKDFHSHYPFSYYRASWGTGIFRDIKSDSELDTWLWESLYVYRPQIIQMNQS